jgi:uncharacterized membrane protein
MDGLIALMLFGGVVGVGIAVARASRGGDALRRRIEDLESAAEREANQARSAFWFLEQRVQKLERQLRERESVRVPELPEPGPSEAPPSQAGESEPVSLAQPATAQEPAPEAVPVQEREFAWPGVEAASEVRQRTPLADAVERVESRRSADAATAEREPGQSAEPAEESAREPDAEPPSAPPSQPPEPSISWEQWAGVRGAAALGAMVAVVAGLYFFKYGIDHGLITPTLRVVLGYATGAALVAGADLYLRPRHRVLGAWLAGAGIAILYLSIWATSVLYRLAGTGVGFFLMCAVTALCCALATVRASLPIAGLGLIGGFATPALLSTGQDRPIALFSYLLVLDVALLWVARRRDWASLAVFSLVGTLGYEAAWIVGRMEPERVALGLAILAVFGALFSVLPGSGREERRVWVALRVAGLIVPLVFGFGLSLMPELAPSSVYLFGPFSLVLVLGATWAEERNGVGWLAPVVVTGALATLAAWALSQPALTPMEWPWAACLLVVALVPQLPRVVPPGARRLGRWCTLGALAVLIVVTAECRAEPWPIEVAVLAAGAFALHVALKQSDARGPIVAAVLGAVAILVVREALVPPEEAAAFEFILLAVAACLGGIERISGAGTDGRSARAGLAGAAFAVAFAALVHWLWTSPNALTASWSSGLLVAAVVLSCAAGARLSGPLHASVLVGAMVALWVLLERGTPGEHPAGWLVLSCAAATALCVAGWPFFSPRLRDDAFAWRAAGAAPLVLFPVVLLGYREQFGRSTQGVAAVVSGLFCLAILAGVRKERAGTRSSDAGVKRIATIWAAACATALLTAAIPLQLDREWITIGWALEAVALLVLWRIFDHAGLQYWALGLLGAVTVRLVLNPNVASYHLGSALPLLNWISYTYLIPAACLVAAWRLLSDLEVERRRSWERQFLPTASPSFSRSCAGAAVVVVFAWINLSVVSWYAPEHRLVLSLENEWARDLTMSIAWAAYALVLLGIGMWRASTALRVTSLMLILGTSAKVFLYDLSRLDDLYRVASLAGLALSLVAISLAYQRLVFRRGLR